jgi:hypothetical protein
MLKYRTPQGETGTILLTYWTPAAGEYASLPADQQAVIISKIGRRMTSFAEASP